MLYKFLDQTNPEYSRGLWDELQELYTGGYAVTRNAGKYLPRLVAEPEVRYQNRLRAASYINYLGQIVDYFASALFSHEIAVTEAADALNPNTPGTVADSPYYAALANNADMCGHSLADVLKGCFITALLKQKAVLAIDMPAVTEQPETLADEEALGLGRAYVYEVPVEQLIDWEYDADGDKLALAVIHRHISQRRGIDGDRKMMRREWKVWTMSPDGYAQWQLFAIETEGHKDLAPDTDIPLVDSGVTSFPRIPLIVLELPQGLWVGNKLGPLAREHFQRRSSLLSSQNQSLVAIPVAKLGPEILGANSEIPSEAQQNPQRGHDPVGRFQALGCVVIGKDDSIEFVEPSGRAYDLIDRQLSNLKDEMFRIVHQMSAAVNVSGAILNRSADSKQQDRVAEAIVLGAFGELVKDFALRAYYLISETRGESIVWTAHGLDNYDDDINRAQVLQEAIQVNSVAIPSKTFKTAYLTQLAFQLNPNLPHETQKQIRQEIEEGVAKQPDIAEQAAAAKSAPNDLNGFNEQKSVRVDGPGPDASQQ